MLAEQRRARRLQRVEVERARPGEHVARGAAGRPRPARRRPGSGRCAPGAEKRASKPAGASAGTAHPHVVGQQPVEPAQQQPVVARPSAGRSTCATCPRACTPASVRPATVSRGGRRAQQHAERLLEHALHGAQLALARPAGEVGAVVGEVEPDPARRDEPALPGGEDGLVGACGDYLSSSAVGAAASAAASASASAPRSTVGLRPRRRRAPAGASRRARPRPPDLGRDLGRRCLGGRARSASTARVGLGCAATAAAVGRLGGERLRPTRAVAPVRRPSSARCGAAGALGLADGLLRDGQGLDQLDDRHRRVVALAVPSLMMRV